MQPLVVFVTAHDEYAVRAFEVNAVDYLLKPVDEARLREAINRVQERLDGADLRAVASIDTIARVHVMPGGTHVVTLYNGQELPVSRLQSRVLRDHLFTL